MTLGKRAGRFVIVAIISLVAALSLAVIAPAQPAPAVSPSAGDISVHAELVIDGMTGWTVQSEYTIANPTPRPSAVRMQLLPTSLDWTPRVRLVGPGSPASDGVPGLSCAADRGSWWLVGSVPANATVVVEVGMYQNLLAISRGTLARPEQLVIGGRLAVYTPPVAGRWQLHGLTFSARLPDDPGVVIPNDPRLAARPAGVAQQAGEPATLQGPANRLRMAVLGADGTDVSYLEPTSAGAPTGLAGTLTAAAWELPNLVTDQAVVFDLYLQKSLSAGLAAGQAALWGLLGAALATFLTARFLRWRAESPEFAVVVRWFRTVARPLVVSLLTLIILVWAAMQLHWVYDPPLATIGSAWISGRGLREVWQPAQPLTLGIGLANLSAFPIRIVGLRAISLERRQDLTVTAAVMARQPSSHIGPLDRWQILDSSQGFAGAGQPASGARLAPGTAAGLESVNQAHAIVFSVEVPPGMPLPADIGEVEITYAILGIRHRVYWNPEGLILPATSVGFGGSTP